MTKSDREVFVMTKDVWRQIGELLHVDLGNATSATIHLQISTPVRVDLNGIYCRKPSSFWDTGYCKVEEANG